MLSPKKILKHGNFADIMIFVIIYSLAFFIAITVSATLSITVKALVPDQTNQVADAWITLAVAFLIFAVVICILINVMD